MEVIFLTDPPFFKIIRNPRYSRNTLLYFPIIRTKPRAILVPLYLQFLPFPSESWNPLGTTVNTLSLVSRVLFSFDDFMLHHSPRFVNTFFQFFNYFLYLFHFSTNYHAFRPRSRLHQIPGENKKAPLPALVPHCHANLPKKGGPV